MSRRLAMPRGCGISSLIACLAIGCGSAVESLTEEQNFFVAASEAIAAGDKPRAMEMLTASINSKPTRYAYFERARLREESGEDGLALEDCAKALEIQPGDKDSLWLQRELRKEKSKRFKGRFATPPSAVK
ncbi:MAG: hypothetical protein KDA61_03755 [Planctomycetales bacterium]|nr:hypothetical protein [Planctomycetales bacterium]